MENLNLNTVSSNINDAYNTNIINANFKEESSQKSENYNSKIHNPAVNVSISMESIKVFLNIKSMEVSQNNASAQNLLNDIINNPEWNSARFQLS